MRHRAGHLAAALTVVVLSIQLGAVTRVPSADGQYWDIQDTAPWGQDSGGIATGGRSNPFNGFGYLKLQVRRGDTSLLRRNEYLRGFGLSYDGAERFDSITPLVEEGVVIARAIFAPRDTSYLRYFDSFSNASGEDRIVEVAWGGASGAYEDGGQVAVAETSSGDRRIDSTDSFVTVMQNARSVSDPSRGPSGHGPSAHVLGTRTSGLVTFVGDMYSDPFVDRWPGFDPAHIGYVFTLRLRPGQTAALVTFVVKGLSETYDPRGGFPVGIKDGLVGAEPVYSGPDANVPAAGSEIARGTGIARRLASDPDLRGLTRRQRAEIANWTLPPEPQPVPFTVFEKSVTDLQQAMTNGDLTSEDIVREYLSRLSQYDRRGPAFHAMLSLNPGVLADARSLDAERAAGRVRGPFHGVPVVFKDNIDVLGLPTTGGSRALVDHRPRLDSHVAAGMKRGGAVVLGKSNLDEFPFGDFGISTVGGTVGNAYDPSLSTAGSSGGSATAISTSLAALGFGTDTCNSLSNPAAFASLATIRTTRGLMSRAGVMPLNTFNDAVGPMARTVRDVALALDWVTGSDAEDSATREAGPHAGKSFAAGLDGARLEGKRFGLLRQRFVGITGEREATEAMQRVVRELQSAGATVVDVAIPDYDARYAAVRGSAPGSLKRAWTEYLARGASPGEKVLTVEDLLASGKLAPASARRFEDALKPAPEGAELEGCDQEILRGPEVVPSDLPGSHGASTPRCDSLSSQPGKTAHTRGRVGTIWIGARHVRRECRNGSSPGDRAGGVHG